MISQLKGFAKSIMMRGDAYLDDKNCTARKNVFGTCFIPNSC